ncbi:MAG: GHKL domain-containing protein [Lachnospiraceae bacterium]
MYNRRKKELQQLEERTALQLETFKDIRSIYNEQQSQIHEFKNYISFIKGLVIEQDYSTLLKYTDSLNERLNLDSSRIKTGNPIIDILLNQTVKKANDNNISLLTNVHIEDPLLIDDNDIIIIISNLLNNALEHCKKLTETNKIINFKLSNDSEQLLIICTNPTESEIKVENNLIETTKKNSLGHGLGLKNIQQIVEKYKGETVISVENNSFKFMIMIHKED